MGYRGKLEERRRARELRARAWTLQEIADELDVAKSSVSVWVRDVEFEVRPRRRVAAQQKFVHPARKAKLEQIARLEAEGRRWIGELSERDLLLAGVALYAGEGAKGGHEASLANTDPRIIWFFCRWLRHFFELDETRLRVSLYLHDCLDLHRANAFWSEVTEIPVSQFTKPYRAEVDDSIRSTKHPVGCATVRYSSVAVGRAIMGLIRALFRPPALLGCFPESGETLLSREAWLQTHPNAEPT